MCARATRRVEDRRQKQKRKSNRESSRIIILTIKGWSQAMPLTNFGVPPRLAGCAFGEELMAVLVPGAVNSKRVLWSIIKAGKNKVSNIPSQQRRPFQTSPGPRGSTRASHRHGQVQRKGMRNRPLRSIRLWQSKRLSLVVRQGTRKEEYVPSPNARPHFLVNIGIPQYVYPREWIRLGRGVSTAISATKSPKVKMNKPC